MTLATIKLIEAVERLNMTGEIGDGMVANLHELATLARLEQAEIGRLIARLDAAASRAERFKAATGKAVEGARALYGNARIVESFQPPDGHISVVEGFAARGERYAAPSACPHPVEWVYKIPETFGAVKCEKCGFVWTP